MKLYIKNMVCPRCIMVVKQIFNDLEIAYHYVHLGETELSAPLPPNKKKELSQQLEKVGFSLIDDRKTRIIDQIKHLIIDRIQKADEKVPDRWANLIADHVHYDYKYLSTLFSSVEGISLEQYIIKQKIEKVKELMIYDELTLTQIAYQLGYSSVAHLSAQFKKITGMNPSTFKTTVYQNRKGLDNVI